MANVGSEVERLKEKIEVPKFTVAREAICPFLLRVFCSTSRHNPMSEYIRGNTPANELQIYTWMDATLKELTGLVKEVNPEARRRGTYFDFSLVFPDLRQGPRCSSRDIGTTVAGQKGPDDQKTLSECKFSIGDYLDISIAPPTGRMDRMDFGRRGGGGFGDRFNDRRGGFGRDRENGGGFGRDRENGGGFGSGGGFGRDRTSRDRENGGGFGAGRERENGGFGGGRDRTSRDKEAGGFGRGRERSRERDGGRG